MYIEKETELTASERELLDNMKNGICSKYNNNNFSGFTDLERKGLVKAIKGDNDWVFGFMKIPPELIKVTKIQKQAFLDMKSKGPVWLSCSEINPKVNYRETTLQALYKKGLVECRTVGYGVYNYRVLPTLENMGINTDS